MSLEESKINTTKYADLVMTEEETIVYSINNSKPIIFEDIDDISIILSILTTSSSQRVNNAIFKTSTGDVYCNSYEKTFNFVIPKEKFNNLMTQLHSKELKFMDHVFNIFYTGFKWTYTYMETASEFVGIKERFEDGTMMQLDLFSSYLTPTVITNNVASCLTAMQKNEDFDKLIITKAQANLYAQYNRESGNLALYFNYSFSSVEMIIMSAGLLDKYFKKIILFGNKMRLVGTRY
jgi:hypothetical protein